MVECNIANCLSLLGRCAEARPLYLGAVRDLAAAGFEIDALDAGYNLSYLDFLDHHYERALEGLGRMKEEAKRRGYPSLSALSALDRSEIFLRLGAHDSALAEAREAIQECGSIGLSYERAKAETFAALAEHRLGQPASAVARLERSLATFHREGNAVWMGETLVGLATVWLREGNARAAAAVLASARQHFASAGDREREACCLALLSTAWLHGGERKSATRYLAMARLRARRRPSPRLRHLTLAAEASLARAQGDVGRARERLRRAATESERIAARVLDEEWRSSFWGEWGWPHLELTTLELGDGRVSEALEALERGRGRALVGTFGRARGADRTRMTRRVREWAASHQARERRRLDRSGPDVLSHSMKPSAASRAGHLTHPLQHLPATPIRTAALQRTLAPGQVLLDYYMHDGTLGVIALSRDGIAARTDLVQERDLVRMVHALLFELRGAVFMPANKRVAGDELKAAFAELAALILWPALTEIRQRGWPASLAIVPVGPLARLPWAALPLPDGRALCEAMELSVVPGLRLSMLAMAEPGAEAGTRVTGPALVIAADAGELEHVANEASAVTARFPGAQLLAGREASAERFLALAPRAPWIHFAGHGHFRADAPHESALRFADRWLLADELAALQLSAAWVGLSACQSARSLVRPGEEWFGLARSFLLSGAHAILASQWDIEDEAAARLMVDLYGRLADGASLGRALSDAQAARLQSGAHPLEWAGFVMLGAGRVGLGKRRASQRSRSSATIEARLEAL
jgi:CHAT domain-containing protein/tetratricopeptide (TPR) repeat protein